MDDRELLIRYRDGELPEADMAAVRTRLSTDPELQASLSWIEKVSAAVERTAAPAFEPFFATRVMARIRAESTSVSDLRYEALRWMFARVAVVSLVIVVALGAYSAIGGAYSGTVIEAMLGLPEVTLESAMTLGG